MQVYWREELRDAWREATQRRLTLLTAPGGAGKTSLARAWAESARAAGTRVAWLALGPLHDDPVTFVEGAIEAIRAVLPEPLEGAEAFGERLRRTLPRAAEPDPAIVVRLLDRDLRGLSRPLILCLDAFEHLSPEGRSTAIVDGLLRAAAPALRLVVTTRGHAPRVSTRLLAEGEAMKLGAQEFSLRSEQVRAILSEEGVCLREDLLARLLARSEGWAIAIRFAARALVAIAPDQQAAFVGTLAREPDLFRYIAHELVEATSPDVRRLLERACLLGPVDRATLARACGSGAASEQIDEALRLGLLQETGGDVAPHELLAEWQRLRLAEQLDEDAWLALHVELGEWLEATDRDLAALRLYRSVELVEPVARLLARAGHALLHRGHVEAVAEALEALPRHRRASDPALLAVAGILEGGRDPEKALEHLRVAVEMYRRSGNRIAEFETLHELGIIAMNENRMDEVLDLHRYALSLRGVLLETRQRGLLALALADGSFLSGRYRLALRMLELASTYEHGPRERGGIGLVRATIHYQRGEWDQVVATVDEACSDEGQRRHGASYYAMQVRRALVLGLRGIDVERSRETLQEAARFFEASRQTVNRFHAELALGQLAARAGAPEEALTRFAGAAALAARIELREAEAAALAFTARIAQRLGRRSEAIDAAEAVLEILEADTTWRRRLSTAACWAPAAVLGALVHAELVGTSRARTAVEARWSHLERRELLLSRHALRCLRARLAEIDGDRRAADRDLRLAKQLAREAELVDRPPEIDDALAEWLRQRGTGRDRLVEGPPEPDAGPAGRLRIDSLGGLRVYRGDHLVSDREWRGETARRLLIRLLCADGRPVARERLEADLWPEASGERARGNLRVALSRLRDVLEPRRRKGSGGTALAVEGERLGLSADTLAGWDVVSWRSAFEALAEATRAVDPDAAHAALARATALHQGDFLPECLDDWALAQRRSLEEAWRSVARRSASDWLARDQPALAGAIATALVDAHRDDETGWLLLARSRIALDDRSGALRVIADAEAALRASLDLEPGPELIALASSLRT